MDTLKWHFANLVAHLVIHAPGALVFGGIGYWLAGWTGAAWGAGISFVAVQACKSTPAELEGKEGDW